MADVFDKLLSQGVRKGHLPARTQTAIQWFRQTAAKTMTTGDALVSSSDKTKLTASVKIGRMYAFKYDPKHKQTLPYYDMFPVIFPFDLAKGGFLGMNLHYLPLPLRAKLMDALYDTISNTKFNENTKLKISYDILKGASKFKWFKPCIKHYLTDHVQSKFIKISSAEWDICAWLPVEKFAKASKQEVWADSRMMK